MAHEVGEAIHAFLETWEEEKSGNKQGFIQLWQRLTGQEGVEIEFHPRPGVTYSLRASHPAHDRPLFVMIDVIEDQPRWLSVCFFGDMISDPEERGAAVPGGLLGEDALCFDLEICTGDQLHYVEARIDEACHCATGR